MSRALLHAKTEEELLTEYCRIVVSEGGYRMAWVGFAEEGQDKRIIPIVYHGHEDGYLKVLNATWAETERGQGPTGRCIRTGEIAVVEDLTAVPLDRSLARRGDQAGIYVVHLHSLPVFRGQNGLPYGVWSQGWPLVRSRTQADGSGRVGTGVRNHHAAHRIGQSSISGKLEYEPGADHRGDRGNRGPARPLHRGPPAQGGGSLRGHRAQTGYSSKRTEGLRLAASIHDLGKMGIPAEILAKPGRLTENQYALIKDHAQVGYEIVKNVEFPWPIAQMILQHHERLDGSGYPRGLKADEIHLESRILAVADVVEAMSSHRPYRPSRGIDVALDEVLSNSGTLYDSATVEACVSSSPGRLPVSTTMSVGH